MCHISHWPRTIITITKCTWAERSKYSDANCNSYDSRYGVLKLCALCHEELILPHEYYSFDSIFNCGNIGAPEKLRTLAGMICPQCRNQPTA